MPRAAKGWPAAEPGAWEGVRGVPGGPLLEQPHAGWERHSVGSALADLALHNAHHLGQAVAVRQAWGNGMRAGG